MKEEGLFSPGRRGGSVLFSPKRREATESPVQFRDDETDLIK